MTDPEPEKGLGYATGYRSFHLVGRVEGLRLVSGVAAHVWQPGTNTAECEFGNHQAPAKDCSCGLYAVLRIEDVPNHGMIGKVQAWGSVFVDDWKMRAAHMHIVELHEPAAPPPCKFCREPSNFVKPRSGNKGLFPMCGSCRDPGEARPIEEAWRAVAAYYHVPLLSTQQSA